MTERQAVKASGAAGYFVIQFLVNKCVSYTPAKNVLEPPSGSLSEGDACVIRWSDGCRYEATVLREAVDYATAKRLEKEELQKLESSKPKSPPAKKRRKTRDEAVLPPPQAKRLEKEELQKLESSKPNCSMACCCFFVCVCVCQIHPQHC